MCVFTAGCGDKTAANGAPGPMPVAIQVAETKTIPDTSEYLSMLKSRHSSAINPQVEGQKVGDINAAIIKAFFQYEGVTVSDDYINDQVYLIWSTSHGIISLTMAGRIAGGRARADWLYEQALRDILEKWERKAEQVQGQSAS